MARWKPSKTKAREFAAQMQDIESYCDEHSISNCAARRMLSSKLFVDQNGKYHWYGRESAIDEVIETLREM